MKSTGIVRKVDELGRVVIPIEIRRNFDLNEGDPMEIYVDGQHVVLRKYQPQCIFCGEAKDVRNLRGKNMCPKCIDELKNI